MIGNNPSVFQGEGYDFIELREYNIGDDIRHIDWNVTAKMRTPFIKVFREERELNVVVSTMLNGSVHFGSTRLKQDLIAEIVAIVGFNVVKNGDLLSSFIFTDKLEMSEKASKRNFVVSKVTQDVLDFSSLNQGSNYSLMADTLYKRVKRRSLIILVGDFFDVPSLKLLAKKHEVICVIVRDRLEENPPEFGFSTLIDPQTGATLEGNFNNSTASAYAQKVRTHDIELYSRFRKENIRFSKIYTDENPIIKLKRLFEAAK
ncbi:MAG: DUF58 domain-containing protein [Helicobacteraceae bacterium]|nr:DUF58 domain-containing protein [Helicobacteraceae bacterium]